MNVRSKRIPRGESDWIQTFSGVQFWPLDPRPEEILIEDIAHALSLLCRFTGHCKKLYTVGEHSIRVSALLESTHPEFAMWGLLHDASEAYLNDISRPVKRSPGIGEIYKCFENLLLETIAEKFGLVWPEPPEVKEADDILLKTEQRDLMGVPPEKLEESRIKPQEDIIYPWKTEEVEHVFLNRYKYLGGK